jgi:hypothetical protein
MAVRADVHPIEPDLTVLDASVTVAQVDAALANGFDLGAEQRDTGFPGVQQMVVVSCFAVVRDDALGGFSF